MGTRGGNKGPAASRVASKYLAKAEANVGKEDKVKYVAEAKKIFNAASDATIKKDFADAVAYMKKSRKSKKSKK